MAQQTWKRSGGSEQSGQRSMLVASWMTVPTTVYEGLKLGGRRKKVVLFGEAYRCDGLEPGSF